MSVRIGEIVITVSGERISTRPTLRAVHSINEDIDVGRVAAAALAGQIAARFRLIEECAADMLSLERFKRLKALPLVHWHKPEIDDAFAKLVPAALCVDLDALADESPRRIEPTPYTKVLDDLFSKAVGWLGMSPEQAWNSTPGAILAGINAHVEKLRLMAGGTKSEDAAEDAAEDDGEPDELDRAGLAELAGLGSLI